MSWPTKSPTDRVFVQQLVQISIKENITYPYYWPFVGGIHRWPVDSHHKWRVVPNDFPCHDVIMSSLDAVEKRDRIHSSPWPSAQNDTKMKLFPFRQGYHLRIRHRGTCRGDSLMAAQAVSRRRRSVDDEKIEDRCDLACPRVHDPVCGSDGVTHPNKCLFHEANCRCVSLPFWPYKHTFEFYLNLFSISHGPSQYLKLLDLQRRQCKVGHAFPLAITSLETFYLDQMILSKRDDISNAITK